MVTVGLDAHSKTCVIVAKDEAGNVVESSSFETTRENLTDLAERYSGAEIVLEASGVSSWIYDTLKEAGARPVAAHPVNIQRVLGTKNDKSDASFLVDAYRIGALSLSYIPPIEIRRLRSLAKQRAFLTRERAAFKNRVHGLLKQRGLRLETETSDPTREIFTKKRRDELSKLDVPELPDLLDIIDLISLRARRLDRVLEKEAQNREETRRLLSIPGFGPHTSIAVFAEIGDITRFANAHSLASYFGLVPTQTQSGESDKHGHITRRGSSLVRWLLNQAAWTHVRTCPKSSLTKDYQRLHKRIGTKKAIVAVERRLVVCAYWLLKENRDFKING